MLQPCQPCSWYPSPVQAEFPGAASPACPLPAGCVCSAASGMGHSGAGARIPGKYFTPWMHRDGSRNSSGNSSSTSGAALFCWWQLPAEPQLQHWSCFSIHFMAKQDGKGEGGVKSPAQLSTGTQQLQGGFGVSAASPCPSPPPNRGG